MWRLSALIRHARACGKVTGTPATSAYTCPNGPFWWGDDPGNVERVRAGGLPMSAAVTPHLRQQLRLNRKESTTMTTPMNGNGSAPHACTDAPGPAINPNPKHPHVALAQVFERVNRAGQRYLVGRVGSAKLLIVPTEVISRGERIW